MKSVQIEGRNSVLELLRRGRLVKEINIDANARLDDKLKGILELADEQGVTTRRVERSALDRMSSTGVHMGVIAKADVPRLPVKLKDVLAQCAEKNQEPFLLILDPLKYQQNFGAIVRTANAAAVHAIIMSGKRMSPVSPEIVRISMGAAFFTPIVRESVFSAIKILKSEGIPIVGADMSGECSYHEVDLRGGVALFVGSEHRGLSQPARKRCDHIVKIPMFGVVSSLNVSVACAILLYEKVRQDQADASSGR